MTTFLHFINLFFAGMLAGIEVAIHYGLGRRIESLDERSQIQLRQALVLRLRVLVPGFFVPSALLGSAFAVADRAARSAWLLDAGLFALLIWVVVRVIRTVPVNSATLTWDPVAPPANWKVMVERTERFHIVGVWAAVAAFALFLAALALS